MSVRSLQKTLWSITSHRKRKKDPSNKYGGVKGTNEKWFEVWKSIFQN